MAYKVIILYRLYMPSYFLGTFTEYPYPSSKIPGLLFSICYLIIVIKQSVHALRVLPSPVPAQYLPFLMGQR